MKDIYVPRHRRKESNVLAGGKPNPNLYYLPSEFTGSYLVKRFESV